MNGNRFEFLEFGEDGAIKPPERAREDDESGMPPAAADPCGPRDAQGRPLAQVLVTDPRGYGPFLRHAGQAEAVQKFGGFGRAIPALRMAEVIGGRGHLAGQFHFPTGIALDWSGVLYVADSYNHRIQRITPSGGVALIGGRGSGRGQFLSPQGVVTDRASAFFVVEQGNNRVQKFSAQGVLEFAFGRSGRGVEALSSPMDIAIAPGTQDIYVADTGNSRVQRYDREGNFLASIGAAGGVYPPLVSPQSIAIDADDNLYVADTFAHQIVQYDPLGRLVGRLAAGKWNEPRAVAWDRSGLLHVADAAMMERSLEPVGRLRSIDLPAGRIWDTARSLNGMGTLKRPSGLAVSWASDPDLMAQPSHGEIYVADTMNHRILRFVWN
jgi:DNA-binding beta-propeller fold protein YncE